MSTTDNKLHPNGFSGAVKSYICIYTYMHVKITINILRTIILVQMSLVFITNAIFDLGYLRQVLSTH